MKTIRIVCLVLFVLASHYCVNKSFAELPSNEYKGKHFIVQYGDRVGLSWAQRVAREAERYYTRIAQQIGYARHKNFWTWDARVKIIVFNSQEEFLGTTGFPEWSKGVAVRDHSVFQSKAIVTYKQEENFLNGVLPHEITHLMLHDFMGGQNNVPVWFDEGVAQLNEDAKRIQANQIMRGLVKKGQFIPFNQLMRYDIRYETNPKRVALFYMQSITIIDFLITKYGSYKFAQLCREMREGKNFETALDHVYKFTVTSIKDLEKKWMADMYY